MDEQKENNQMEENETPQQGSSMNPMKNLMKHPVMQHPVMQNRNVRLFAAVALLAAALFVVAARDNVPVYDFEEMQGEEQEQEQVEGAALYSEITLNEQNASGQSGAALLTDLGDGTTRVVLSAPGSFVNPQPAHIHSGTCENLGGVVHPLANVEGGSSDTVVNASLQSLTAGTFAINIHMSAEQSDVYTACGNI